MIRIKSDKVSRFANVVLPSTVISWIANRKMIVQIIPSVIFRFPSTIS